MITNEVKAKLKALGFERVELKAIGLEVCIKGKKHGTPVYRILEGRDLEGHRSYGLESCRFICNKTGNTLIDLNYLNPVAYL